MKMNLFEEPEKLNEYSAYNELITEAELKNDFNLATEIFVFAIA